MLCIPNTDVVSVRVCVTYVWSSEGVHTRLCGHDNKLQNTFVSVVESEPALRPPPYRVEETLRHTGHFETMTSLVSTLLFVYMWNGATKHLWPVSDFEDVLVTVAFLLRRNPRAQFWTTYQERRSSTWKTTTTTTVPSLSVVSTDVSIAASGLTLLLLFLPMFQCRLVDRSSAPPVEAELRRRPAEHVWCRWSRAGRVESAGQPQRRHDDHHAWSLKMNEERRQCLTVRIQHEMLLDVYRAESFSSEDSHISHVELKNMNSIFSVSSALCPKSIVTYNVGWSKVSDKIKTDGISSFSLLLVFMWSHV